VRTPRPIAWVLALLCAAAFVLLAKLGHDLAALGLWPIWALFALAFGAAGANVLAVLRGEGSPLAPGRARTALLAIVPLSFAASVLDCMGLSFHGCTEACTALIQLGVPAVALLALATRFTGSSAAFSALSLAPLAFLYPNCLCRNPINRDWIDWLGQSPACFASAVGVSIVCLAALHSGKRVTASLVAAGTMLACQLAFFVGHHFFRIPW